jgi:hypothetical protein
MPKDLKLVGDFYCKDGLIWIPDSFSKEFGTAVHILLGHPGMLAFEEAVKRRFYMPQMKTVSQNLSKYCLNIV